MRIRGKKVKEATPQRVKYFFILMAFSLFLPYWITKMLMSDEEEVTLLLSHEDKEQLLNDMAQQEDRITYDYWNQKRNNHNNATSANKHRDDQIMREILLQQPTTTTTTTTTTTMRTSTIDHEIIITSHDNNNIMNMQQQQQRHTNKNVHQQQEQQRLAIACFVDNPEHLYGVYSIKTQMDKLQMSQQGIEQVVLIPDDKRYEWQWRKRLYALETWFKGRPDKHIIEVPKDYILSKVPKTKTRHQGIWKGVFNKLWFFNLTQYDKVITLDTDILIRNNLVHWFDLPTPCGTQADGKVEINSGAMVIEPSTRVFNEMIQTMPKMVRYGVVLGDNDDDEEEDNDNEENNSVSKFFRNNAKQTKQDSNELKDNWNSGWGQQGFLSAFFTQSRNPYERMYTMPIQYSPLSSALVRIDNKGKEIGYFKTFRPHIFDTVHFTVHKPYKEKNGAISDAFLCDAMLEFFVSLEGIEQYLEPIQIDHFEKCPGDKDKYAKYRPKPPHPCKNMLWGGWNLFRDCVFSPFYGLPEQQKHQSNNKERQGSVPMLKRQSRRKKRMEQKEEKEKIMAPPVLDESDERRRT